MCQMLGKRFGWLSHLILIVSLCLGTVITRISHSLAQDSVIIEMLYYAFATDIPGFGS